MKTAAGAGHRRRTVSLFRATVAHVLLLAPLLLCTPASPAFAGEADPGRTGDGPVATAPRADLDDVLDGFDDPELLPRRPIRDPEDDGGRERFWDLSGSVSLGSSYDLRPHRSSVGPDPGRGTRYAGLQRLRLRGDLQLDLDLPGGWKARAQGFGFYDFAYLIDGRDSYTHEVLDDYEYELDVLDAWVQGSVSENLDLKLGRQVVNWGRSDTLRVTDVLNPVNNREPGLADIEELRLPVTMAKADYYWRNWNLTALFIPEIRYDENPVLGSDFCLSPELSDVPDPQPPVTRQQVDAVLAQLAPAISERVCDNKAPRWSWPGELGGALTGTFSGWDVSLYLANVFQNSATPLLDLTSFEVADDDQRVTMLGAGANYTFGSWLFKGELAWFDGLEYVFLRPNPSPTSILDAYTTERIETSRLDAMLGVEYYGFADTTISLEVVDRHLFDYDRLLEYLPNYLEQDSVQTALRISRDLLNARLHLSGTAVVLGESAQHGSILRLDAGYDLAEALTIGGGLLYFVEGDTPPLDQWGRNDRLFLELRYSF